MSDEKIFFPSSNNSGSSPRAPAEPQLRNSDSGGGKWVSAKADPLSISELENGIKRHRPRADFTAGRHPPKLENAAAFLSSSPPTTHSPNPSIVANITTSSSSPPQKQEKPAPLSRQASAASLPSAPSNPNQVIFTTIASSIQGFPPDRLDPPRDFVRQLPVVLATATGPSKATCTILSDSLLLSTRGSKVSSFLGLLEQPQMHVSKVHPSSVAARFKPSKYKKWLLIRYQHNKEYFLSAADEQEVDSIFSYLSAAVSRRPTRSFSICSSPSIPLARFGHTLTNVTGKLILIGGSCQSSTEVWIFDAYISTWVRVPVMGMPSLVYHSATLYEGKVYVFGGKKDGNPSNTLYCFDPTKFLLTEVKTQGVLPPARWRHVAAELAGSLYIYGGQTTDKDFQSDIWCLDFKTETWRCIQTQTQPPARASCVSAAHDGKLFIWGGVCGSTLLGKELFIFEARTETWKQSNLGGAVPSARFGSLLVQNDATLYIFGGQTEFEILGDIYSFNCANRVCKRSGDLWPLPLRSDGAAALVAIDKLMMFFFGGKYDSCDMAVASDALLKIDISSRVFSEFWRADTSDLIVGMKQFNLCAESSREEQSVSSLAGGVSLEFAPTSPGSRRPSMPERTRSSSLLVQDNSSLPPNIRQAIKTAAHYPAVFGYSIGIDTNELESPYPCIAYKFSSTHVSFLGSQERHLSYLEHACCFSESAEAAAQKSSPSTPSSATSENEILLFRSNSNSAAMVFSVRPRAAKDAFVKFFTQLRRGLLQKIFESGAAVSIPVISTSGINDGRLLILTAKSLYLNTLHPPETIELAIKNIKGVKFNESANDNLIFFEVPSKLGNTFSIQCLNAAFINLTLRDWLAKKLSKESSTRMALRETAFVSSSETQRWYFDSPSLYLAHRIRKDYEDEKRKFDLMKNSTKSKRPSDPNNTTTSHLITIPASELSIIHELGRGSNGVIVSMAQWRQKYVALKTFVVLTHEELQGLLAEAALSARIQPHINVLRTFGVTTDGNKYSLVLELATRGSLLSLLQSNRIANKPLSMLAQVRLLRGIVRGMCAIAQAEIVHRDLAARNVLLGGGYLEPKICDFGYSRNMKTGSHLSTAFASSQDQLGPVRWMAPEVHATHVYSEKSDVWAFGITAIEIMSMGMLPYHWVQDLLSLAVGIRDGTIHPLQVTSPSWPEEIRKLISPCFDSDPSRRPTFAQLSETIDREFGRALEMEIQAELLHHSLPASGESSNVDTPSMEAPALSATSQIASTGPLQLYDDKGLKELKQLGRGEYGSVFLSLWNGELVAVKRINANADASAQQIFRKEIDLMCAVATHRNVIKTKAFCIEPSCMFLVAELASNGNLETLLQKINRKLEPALDQHMIFYIALAVAEGMAFLHSQGIVHRDLAARNVLFLEDWTPVVSDFGFARSISVGDSQQAQTMSSVGPIRTMAPEAMMRNYSMKSDVWAFGALLLELFTLNMPYPEMDLVSIAERVRDSKLSPYIWLTTTGAANSSLKVPPWATEVIRMCSEFDQKNRPSFAKLVTTLTKSLDSVIVQTRKDQLDRVIKSDFLV